MNLFDLFKMTTILIFPLPQTEPHTAMTDNNKHGDYHNHKLDTVIEMPDSILAERKIPVIGNNWQRFKNIDLRGHTADGTAVNTIRRALGLEHHRVFPSQQPHLQHLQRRLGVFVPKLQCYRLMLLSTRLSGFACSDIGNMIRTYLVDVECIHEMLSTYNITYEILCKSGTLLAQNTRHKFMLLTGLIEPELMYVAEKIPAYIEEIQSREEQRAMEIQRMYKNRDMEIQSIKKQYDMEIQRMYKNRDVVFQHMDEKYCREKQSIYKQYCMEKRSIYEKYCMKIQSAIAKRRHAMVEKSRFKDAVRVIIKTPFEEIDVFEGISFRESSGTITRHIRKNVITFLHKHTRLSGGKAVSWGVRLVLQHYLYRGKLTEIQRKCINDAMLTEIQRKCINDAMLTEIQQMLY